MPNSKLLFSRGRLKAVSVCTHTSSSAVMSCMWERSEISDSSEWIRASRKEVLMLLSPSGDIRVMEVKGIQNVHKNGQGHDRENDLGPTW